MLATKQPPVTSQNQGQRTNQTELRPDQTEVTLITNMDKPDRSNLSYKQEQKSVSTGELWKEQNPTVNQKHEVKQQQHRHRQ